jgi:hypothetical protein
MEVSRRFLFADALTDATGVDTSKTFKELSQTTTTHITKSVQRRNLFM